MDITTRLLLDGEKICLGRVHATKYLPKKKLVEVARMIFEWLHTYRSDDGRSNAEIMISDAEVKTGEPGAGEYTEAYQRQFEFEIRKRVGSCHKDQDTEKYWHQDILMTINLHAIARPMLPPEKDVKDDSHG